MPSKPSLFSRPCTPFVLLAALLIPISAARAQTPADPAAKAVDQALEQFNAGSYKESAAAFDAFIQANPTSQALPTAQLYAGYSYYLLGENDKAITLFRKILQPPATEDIQEVGYSLISEALAAKAAALPDNAPGRVAAFQQAIDQYGVYLKKFPKSPEVEAATYGRAISYYQIGKYKEAEGDLRNELQAYPQSASVQDSQYLLALTLATQANLAMQSGSEPQKAEATKQFEEAERVLNDIITKRQSLVISNDARFQLGEVALVRAVYAKPEQREALYEKALAQYRSVEPKEAMIKAQLDRLKLIDQQYRDAIKAGNKIGAKTLHRLRERETAKLEQVKSKSDQTLASNLKVGELFYRIGDYDASRVAMDYLARFADTDEQRKTVLYYKSMTYALQGQIDKAIAAFNEFQEKFKGDPMAENLPVAVGTMFLTNPDPKRNDPKRAIEFFDMALKAYPQGRMGTLIALQKASAQVSLGQHEAALKTFQNFLTQNKDAAKEMRVQAELGIANIYRDTKRWDEAIAAYGKIKTDYADNASGAENAFFWGAWSLFQKGDVKAALPELRAFADKFPESTTTPNALFMLAQGQASTGQKADAIKTYREISAKYPKSEPAVFAYFQIASIQASEQKADELVATMREFLEKYPQDKNVYFAYDSISQNLANTGKTAEALTPLEEFAAKYPTSENAPRALLKASELARGLATALGKNYPALPPETQEPWKANLERSIKLAETVVEKYPDSPVTALALQSLLENQKLNVAANLLPAAGLEDYFNKLSEKFTGKTKSKVLFTLAGYIGEQDRKRALEIMTKAYDPSVIYTPADLDLYGSALLSQGKVEQAEAVYRKVGADFPIAAGTAVAQAPRTVQDAQSVMLYGLGSVLQKQNKLDEAGKLFAQLKQDYPWSPKILEANFGIAQSLKAEGKLDDAMKLLVGVIRSTTAPAELRAKAMLLGGQIFQARNDNDAAIDYYMKIAAFYSGVPTTAAEGLWLGAQLIEVQAATITDPKKKADQIEKARKAYQSLSKDYPGSPNVEQARKRLTALGGEK